MSILESLLQGLRRACIHGAALVGMGAAVMAVMPWSAHAAESSGAPTRLSKRALLLVQLDVARAGQRLVSVGERGSILLSDDHGKSWRQVPTSVSVALVRVVFADARNGWAVGHGGVVLHSADGGENWRQQLDGITAARLERAAAQAVADPRRRAEAERLVADGADKPFLAVQFGDARRGWIAGAYGLLFATDNGGQSWRSLIGESQAAAGRHLYAVLQQGKVLFAAGEQGTLIRSIDGGASFSRLDFPGKGTVFGLLRSPDGALLTYGLKGHVYRSSDAGRLWSAVAMPPLSLTAGVILANGDLVLADETGRLHRSSDGGKHFTPLPIRDPAPISGLFEAADGTLIGSGLRGVSRIELITHAEEAKQ